MPLPVSFLSCPHSSSSLTCPLSSSPLSHTLTVPVLSSHALIVPVLSCLTVLVHSCSRSSSPVLPSHLPVFSHPHSSSPLIPSQFQSSHVITVPVHPSPHISSSLTPWQFQSSHALHTAQLQACSPRQLRREARVTAGREYLLGGALAALTAPSNLFKNVSTAVCLYASRERQRKSDESRNVRNQRYEGGTQSSVGNALLS